MVMMGKNLVGRPTLEKCKQIKKRREFEEEMREIDPRNIISTRLRHQNDKPQLEDGKHAKSHAMVISSDDDDDDSDDESEHLATSEDEYDSDSNGSDHSESNGD